MNETLSDEEVDKIIKHWVKTSDDDCKTMLRLYDSKSYSWSLFLGHITVERLLKAIYVKIHKQQAPHTHNLYRLVELCGIEINEEYSNWLFQITSFNINARYDDYKKEFYKLCTKDFTKLWIERIKKICKWVKQKL